MKWDAKNDIKNYIVIPKPRKSKINFNVLTCMFYWFLRLPFLMIIFEREIAVLSFNTERSYVFYHFCYSPNRTLRSNIDTLSTQWNKRVYFDFKIFTEYVKGFSGSFWGCRSGLCFCLYSNGLNPFPRIIRIYPIRCLPNSSQLAHKNFFVWQTWNGLSRLWANYVDNAALCSTFVHFWKMARKS